MRTETEALMIVLKWVWDFELEFYETDIGRFDGFVFLYNIG